MSQSRLKSSPTGIAAAVLYSGLCLTVGMCGCPPAADVGLPTTLQIGSPGNTRTDVAAVVLGPDGQRLALLGSHDGHGGIESLDAFEFTDASGTSLRVVLPSANPAARASGGAILFEIEGLVVEIAINDADRATVRLISADLRQLLQTQEVTWSCGELTNVVGSLEQAFCRASGVLACASQAGVPTYVAGASVAAAALIGDAEDFAELVCAQAGDLPVEVGASYAQISADVDQWYEALAALLDEVLPDGDQPCGSPGPITAFAAGINHSLAADDAGQVWAWGADRCGQLGDGSTANRSIPACIPGLGNVIAVSGGTGHGLALLSDGTAKAWGCNSYGQLGDGTSMGAQQPVQVVGLNHVVAIAAGHDYCLALRSDGTIWAWGSNTYNQLGDGTTTNRFAPVQVPGLRDVAAVAAGAGHSLALKTDGTLWAWGFNGFGAVGDGTTTHRSLPVLVPGLPGVIAVAAGAAHSLALRADGTVWAWGLNDVGELGNGTSGNHDPNPDPRPALDLAGVIAIAGGEVHSLALRGDGTVWAWGFNRYGSVGDGTTTDRNVPVAVSGLTDVVAIAAHGGHNLAQKSDGSVWAWGLNSEGQLGDGTTTHQYTPVQVLLR